ncbi:MAG: DNA-directed RNA polymerase subunit beta [Elusimicrobia bacterium]|nr:DNA-directed RNA polymerase subunit beta [Elusimicrobiota bacterium]
MKKTSFARIRPVIDIPQLLEMQRASYREFLQIDVPVKERKVQGIQASFMDIFPIINSDESLALEFVQYNLGTPKYTIEEAIDKDGTYATPLKAVLRLVHRQPSGKPKVLTEQEVYLCELPLMTDTASFIINGAERVVVSQLHRSPGVIFEEDDEKNISSYGKNLFYARIIPYRGAWVEFEFDLNNAIFVRIDKKRKFPATTLLRAAGIETNAQILELFYNIETLPVEGGNLAGRILADDVVEADTGEVLLEANTEISKEAALRFQEKKIKSVKVIVTDPALNDIAIRNTLLKDPVRSRKEAIHTIYRVVRSQEFIVPEQAENYLDTLLFKSIRHYDFTKVGRFKINRKLLPLYSTLLKKKGFGFEIPSERRRTLSLEDIIVTLQYLIALNNGLTTIDVGNEKIKVEIDDIDHLGNRRVRGVGELLENQIRMGLAQMSRMARDRMNLQDEPNPTPRSVLNTAPVAASVRKFFGSSQLSQFMDQTNPLSELTHKRRMSALGPGGLHRKRAGFEVRDVHHTHYGRICPIETPEGPNIGLITSLACFARINQYGLIESPYRAVKKGEVSSEVEYLTADKEDDYTVAQANSVIDKNGKFQSEAVACRFRGDFPQKNPNDINFMDISPAQVVSISTALIPFLEHDDANRALMGSNMQRQAVPLLVPEAPFVATGIEAAVAQDSGAALTAKRSGLVTSVWSDQVAIYTDDGEVDIYRLRKYARSNQDTCVNQIPFVKVGDRVKKGDVVCDGPSTDQGELALGKNLVVAFMPWEGYNFEDAILLNEKLVRDDLFTSIHISEFQIEARDTKLGAEEITRDIPNVGADALINLDENGIIRPGAEVGPGDILVGKVAPKGEQQITPEERLLKVIFGKKAEDVMDASLRVPPGIRGKVISTRSFIRKEKLSKKEENKRMKDIETELEDKLEWIRTQKKERFARIEQDLEDKTITSKQASDLKETAKALAQKLESEARFEAARLKENLKNGDDLPVTVNRVVKVFIGMKRKVQVGDKLAGRHGNKGVVARVMPPQDMPYMADGTPVDVVLSPLGVPSRMNVGQLLEVMLGWAGKTLNTQMITPVFDGAKEEQIIDSIRLAKDHLRKSGVREDFLPGDYCDMTLYDGRTGEAFSEKVTVGVMYMLKLAHMVEDKIHARSTGPYSLITRQPLGGKAQFGGQRFGEMEVWAIEGYGASHILQEFLTVKSDDANGRTKMYEAIIRGESVTEPGIPESFKVLVRELQSLGVNVELLRQKDGTSIQALDLTDETQKEPETSISGVAKEME